MPKISIIIPLYNGSKLLSETVDSIFAQDYTDWEIIFFDDGSNDGTQEAAKGIAESQPEKIFYFEHENNSNHGTAYTRNRAVERSNGEIISFLDQDDIWYKNKLSYQLKLFEDSKDCSMMWGPSLYWYGDRSFDQPVGYRGQGLKNGIYDPPEFVKIFLSSFRSTPLPSASLVRRKHFDQVKGYEESIKGSEDIVLWLKLADKYKILFDNEVLTRHRKHQASTLRKAAESGKMDEWNLVFYKWILDFLKNRKGNEVLTKEVEFMYYKGLKRIAAREGYLGSRKNLLKGLRSCPEIGNKYIKDYFLDLVLPFDIASKVSDKLRFELFKNK